MQKHLAAPEHIYDSPDPDDRRTLTEIYLASEVDAVLKRQAAAAVAGMNAATAISRGQVQQAHRLRAESNPEALESERQANAILTERIAELEREVRELVLANTALKAELDYYHDEG
jgi:hypothetical protein